MTSTRRQIIHAALEHGDHALAEALLAGKCSWQTLNLYAAHYGIA